MEAVVAVDRFENDLAMLLGDDGSEFVVRRHLLPPDVREGGVLRVPIGDQGPDWSRAVVDDAERRRREIEARRRLDRLRRRDPGGDFEL